MTPTASPTPPAFVTCPQCAAQVPSYDPAHSRYFCCFNCRTYFRAYPDVPAQAARPLDGFKRKVLPEASLPLGAVAQLGGYQCRVTGYQVRGEKADKTAEWREYQLRPATPTGADDPADFPLQLAEYQGHWLLIRRAQKFPDTRGPRSTQDGTYEDETGHEYRRWHRYQPVVRDAQGEFDWNILDDENLEIEEFTGPPYMLVSEQPPNDRPTWYRAEHLTQAAVAAAFGLSELKLPLQRGIGAATPAPVPGWPQLRRLGVLAVLLLLALQAVLLVLRQPTSVLDQEFTASTATAGGTSQMLTSDSFELGNSSALEVKLHLPSLDNHWAEVTASLVNEQTGRGFEFTRSVEYYHGYEGGESWSEGGTSAEATLAGVPAGRYHFNLYPALDPGAGAVALGLHVEANTPLWANFWLALLVLGGLPLALGWHRNNFERSRWANSDYNPYSSTSDT